MILQCKSCHKEVSRWRYEVAQFKNKKYLCLSCKSKESKEVRTCPVCKKEFTVFKREKKITCSRACSNKHFRTGENNGNWKLDTYRSTCFAFHKKECIICKESNIVAVHHYDENHNNNKPDNLIPLCPTHHQYMHSNFKHLILEKVDKYVKDFKRAVA